jgi:hypothetical protein
VLELGCGTGKNTAWLVLHARHVLGLDEVTLHGMLQSRNGELFLARGGQPELRLDGLQAASKLQWDHTARQRRPLLANEGEAHGRLYALARDPAQPSSLSVTGPLELSERS